MVKIKPYRPLDKGIEFTVQELWQRGYKTLHSCQGVLDIEDINLKGRRSKEGHDYRAYIMFDFDQISYDQYFELRKNNLNVDNFRGHTQIRAELRETETFEFKMNDYLEQVQANKDFQDIILKVLNWKN